MQGSIGLAFVTVAGVRRAVTIMRYRAAAKDGDSVEPHGSSNVMPPAGTRRLKESGHVSRIAKHAREHPAIAADGGTHGIADEGIIHGSQ